MPSSFTRVRPSAGCALHCHLTSATLPVTSSSLRCLVQRLTLRHSRSLRAMLRVHAPGEVGSAVSIPWTLATRASIINDRRPCYVALRYHLPSASQPFVSPVLRSCPLPFRDQPEACARVYDAYRYYQPHRFSFPAPAVTTQRQCFYLIYRSGLLTLSSLHPFGA